MASSPVFIYKSLRPHIQFHVQSKSISARGEKFLQCEDNLLVLGLDQYAHNWNDIRKHYLPVKTLNQIKIRRKNLCSKRAPDNVVKQYKKTGKIPNFPTVPVIPGNIHVLCRVCQETESTEVDACLEFECLNPRVYDA
jgi:hypothetical protein